MNERPFNPEPCFGGFVREAMDVVAEDEDARWRYRSELDGHCISGTGKLPPARSRNARLTTRAAEQREHLVRPPCDRGMQGGVR